jgi:hypothetical protein
MSAGHVVALSERAHAGHHDELSPIEARRDDCKMLGCRRYDSVTVTA